MANIWRVYEGREPTQGGPWVQMAADEAARLLDLRREDYLSDLDNTPKFGDERRDLSWKGYKHAVVEIEDAESVTWRPGFYRVRYTLEQVFDKLLQQALAKALGEDSVIRVEKERALNFDGEEVLKVLVVIAPDAVKKMPRGAPLSALVQLRQRLHEMGEERTPIVEYATEAELAQDVGYQS